MSSVWLHLVLAVEAVQVVDDVSTGIGAASVIKEGLAFERRLSERRELATNKRKVDGGHGVTPSKQVGSHDSYAKGGAMHEGGKTTPKQRPNAGIMHSM